MARALLQPPLLLALALGLACASSQKPAGYEEAAREARLNAMFPDHFLYHTDVEKRVRDRAERASRRCSVRFPDTRGARLLYLLDADGAPREMLIYPDAEFGRCVQEGIEEITFSPPPEPDYWIAVDVAPTLRGDVRVPGAQR